MIFLRVSLTLCFETRTKSLCHHHIVATHTRGWTGSLMIEHAVTRYLLLRGLQDTSITWRLAHEQTNVGKTGKQSCYGKYRFVAFSSLYHSSSHPFLPTPFAKHTNRTNMTTPITVSAQMKALWSTPTTGGAHEGKGKGHIIAVRYPAKKRDREWLVGSPPVWYKPPLNDDQKDVWKTKDKTNLVIQNLDLGADAHLMRVYRAGKFLVEIGNVLVDPFATPANNAGAGVAQNTGAGQDDEEEDEDEEEFEEQDIIQSDTDDEEDAATHSTSAGEAEGSEDEDGDRKELAKMLRINREKMEEDDERLRHG
jgi:hypothetical protein